MGVTVSLVALTQVWLVASVSDTEWSGSSPNTYIVWGCGHGAQERHRDDSAAHEARPQAIHTLSGQERFIRVPEDAAPESQHLHQEASRLRAPVALHRVGDGYKKRAAIILGSPAVLS